LRSDETAGQNRTVRQDRKSLAVIAAVAVLSGAVDEIASEEFPALR